MIELFPRVKEKYLKTKEQLEQEGKIKQTYRQPKIPELKQQLNEQNEKLANQVVKSALTSNNISLTTDNLIRLSSAPLTYLFE